MVLFDRYNCREKALYCYENTDTGEIQWEYPQLETTETASDNVAIADDAMDICTTPPPNEHEDLTATVFQTNGKLIFQKTFISNKISFKLISSIEINAISQILMQLNAFHHSHIHHRHQNGRPMKRRKAIR